MDSLPFPSAVVVWLDPRRPDFGVKLVEDVPEALYSLHRHGLEEAIRGPQSSLWKSAAGALVQAEVDPSPSNLRVAYEAFLQLAKCVAPVPTKIRKVVCPRAPRERIASFFSMA
ncbi:UNVERIFIED_CONTAM: hypothetical protein Q9R58_14220 [Methylobacteriaceae bacterium AG10]|jgi:hypothetical protein|nr:hypothetical protein [Methylobacteriaceae bacterium AG10]